MMKRVEALTLLKSYCSHLDVQAGFATLRPALENAREMWNRFPVTGTAAKAMRWLGYMQGVCVASGVFSLEQVKEHEKNRRLG